MTLTMWCGRLRGQHHIPCHLKLHFTSPEILPIHSNCFLLKLARSVPQFHFPIRHVLSHRRSFSDWKFDEGEQYFPKPSQSKFKRKSGPVVILDAEEEEKPFESPYAKIRRQKNPSFSRSKPTKKSKQSTDSSPSDPTARSPTSSHDDPLGSLQPLIPKHSQHESRDNDHDEDSDDSEALIAQQRYEADQLTKWREWKTQQIKTKEYIPRSDLHTPRTLEDFKNWNIKQDEAAKYKQLQHEQIKQEEELRSFDLMRSGHIVQALQVPKVNVADNTKSGLMANTESGDSSLALSEKHKFDFSAEATYVLEGMKLFEYYAMKYGYYFGSGFLKISILSSIALYGVLHQEVVTQSEIVDALQTLKPFTASTLDIAASDSLSDVWWNTLSGSCLVPMVVAAGIYAKGRGEVWEWKELRKQPIDSVDLKSDVLTLSDKKSISSNKLIYEVALIRERRRERMDKLAPLHDVVDITKTFSPHRKSGLAAGGGMPLSPKRMVEKGHKMQKFMKKHGVGKGLALFMSTSFSAADPRRAGSTQNFGLLMLQTRLDEFGRVIPGWQRQSTKLWIAPTVAIFLFFPPFGDWLLGWTA